MKKKKEERNNYETRNNWLTVEERIELDKIRRFIKPKCKQNKKK